MDIRLPEVTLQQLLLRLAATLLTLAVSGFVTTWAVRRAGDPGPAHDGRLTLSPFAHLDLAAGLAGLFFRVTWLRPLEADPRMFRSPVRGTATVVALSTLSLVVLALAALFGRTMVVQALGARAALTPVQVLTATYEVAIGTALLNLLPLPPLLGGLWWGAIGAEAGRLAARQSVRVIGTCVVAALLLTGLAEQLLALVRRSLMQLAGF